jgi:hypothetical protein
MHTGRLPWHSIVLMYEDDQMTICGSRRIKQGRHCMFTYVLTHQISCKRSKVNLCMQNRGLSDIQG